MSASLVGSEMCIRDRSSASKRMDGRSAIASQVGPKACGLPAPSARAPAASAGPRPQQPVVP
eukprot:12723418-Alexandrium_andersonii.AAC.1